MKLQPFFLDFKFCIALIKNATTEFQLYAAQVAAENYFNWHKDIESFNILINLINTKNEQR